MPKRLKRRGRDRGLCADQAQNPDREVHMDDMVYVERLTAFGLTRQEASIYLCLYKNGTLTGYEAAKLTGISRSNVYNALAGLAEKGAAYLLEGSSSRYMAVPIGELCDNKLRALAEAGRWLEQNMPTAVQPAEGYITIVGEQQILDKMHHMLEEAGKRIYLAASSEWVARFAPELSLLLAKRIKLDNFRSAMIYGGIVGSTSGVSAGLTATDPKLVPYGAMTAIFLTGLGCLMCPTVFFGVVNLIF